jgi:hypothetical protein
VYVLPGLKKNPDRIRIGRAAKWILISQDTLVRVTKNGWLPCMVNRVQWRYFRLKDLYECYFLTFSAAARFFGVSARLLRKLCRFQIRRYSARYRQPGVRFTYRISLAMACLVLNGLVHKSQIILRAVPNNTEVHSLERFAKAMKVTRPASVAVPAMGGK